jgi:ribosomal protein S18 acetylase RimI-like enzyme
MDIRLLGPTDHAVLADVATDVFDDRLQPGAVDEFLRDPRHHLVVAIDDARVVGFVSAVHYVHPDKKAPELWINEVAVSEALQGRGVGKAMLRKMLDHAHVLGCVEAWVLTNRSNRAAMRLYESSGGVNPADDEVMFNFSLGTPRAE